jgi:hypothetical protein
MVFPTVALVASLGLILQHRRKRLALAPAAMAAILIYIFEFGFLVVMTLRPNRILEFDYFASILIPAMFLALGLTMFRVPDAWQGPRLYLLLAFSGAVFLAPLAKVGLYRTALVGGLTLACFIGAAAVAIRLIWPRQTASWIALVCMLPVAGFGLTPNYPGLAWRMEYDGIASTKRIAAAISRIEAKLPADAYPAFWINNVNGLLVSEYRAIMCGFQSHGLSMYEYPQIDPHRTYKPGTFVILITDDRDVFDAANQTMTQAGMPLSLYGQDLIAVGDISYWVTYVRVLDTGKQRVPRN